MFEQTFKNIDDTLWKDAGCSSELDYVEQTSWILFLKYLDDLEKDRKDMAELSGKSYAPIIDEEYKWEAWAAPKVHSGNPSTAAGKNTRLRSERSNHHKALTGDDLTDFVNGELFPYLNKFKTTAESPDTIEYKIGEIFSELKNKLQSGYNLREVINLIDELRFRSSTEKHEMCALYEDKDQEHGQCRRNGGEYYTPRPLIKTIVQVVAPQIGETIYDGAVGSAGFLCEAFEYLKTKKGPDHPRCGNAAKTNLLRQGKEIAGLHHRHDEHDPARHRSAQHRAYQHAGGEHQRYSGKRPLQDRSGQSALWRQGTQGGAAQLPDQNRRDGLSVLAALHQDPESGRTGRGGHQEHLSLKYRQRVGQPAARTVGEL